MNREEAKQDIFIGKGIKSHAMNVDGEIDALWLNRRGVLGFIDKIYDDFESKTCENCKHFDSHSSVCFEPKICEDNSGYVRITKDFGCNKYEPKNVQ